MDMENLFPFFHIRNIKYHSPIEPTRSEEGGIEDIRTIRRGHHNHVCTSFEAIHFRQNLIQSLLTLVVAAAETRAALSSDCIDFIHEYD